MANHEGRTVAAVDLTSFTLAGQIALDGQPTTVLAHPAQPLACALTPGTGTVYEIEAAGLKVQRKVQVARAAISMRPAPHGRSVWVLCGEPRQLVQLNLDRFQVDTRIPLPAAPTDFDLSPDGALAATSLADGGVVFLDLANRRAHRPVEPDRRAAAVRFRSDGRQLLVGNTDERLLSVLRAPDGRVVVRLPLAVRPENFCFKGDGGQLFLTGAGMDAVVVVYPFRTEVAETALAGKAPAQMAASTSPDYLFVSNPPTGDVTVLDIETRRAIAVVAVGEMPGYIAITPDSQYALVLNQRSGSMAVIRIAAIVSKRTKSAPLFTMIPVGSRPVSAAVCWA